MWSSEIGETVIVDKRSEMIKGSVRLLPARPIMQTIDKVYLDGRIRTSSGDTWVVKRLPNGKLRAVR